ncbi:Protein CBG25496 [Caenorhabditis briggsae]|uniref:Protein CBG25496 n=1 Tax=Caenorhabditis briggsae TaxID=6238 RepID=B6IEN6_CAEBR|nr:Protein CBG25496 [Caenorhabditis briggsae]CAR98366.1 Protein CBG25496 [Caenorhabditis briggsae]
MFNAFFDFETLNGLESCLQFWDHATYIFKPKKIIVEFHNDQLASEQIRKYLAISLQKEYHQISIRRGTVDSEYLDYLMENVNLNSKLLIGKKNWRRRKKHLRTTLIGKVQRNGCGGSSISGVVIKVCQKRNREPSGRRPPSKHHPLGVFRSSGHAILCCPRAVRGQPVRLYPDAGSPGKNRDQSGRSSGWGVTRLGRASPLPNHAQQHEPEQYFAFERSESECEAQDWKEYKKTTWDVRPWDVEVAQKESCHFLAEHLVARLTDPDVAKIPAKFINRHPYFWSDDLKLDYIQAVSEKFKSLKLANVPERVLIEMDSNDVIGRSFKTKLCTVIASVVSKYNGWEVYDVLRRIRNFKAHYYEASTAVSQVFSPEPIKILEHFSKLLTISI